MMQKIVLTILLLFSISVESQSASDISEEIEDTSISAQFYTKCFENLNQETEIFKKYPAFKNMKFCSIFKCSFLLSYKEEEIKLFGEKLLIGIATQLFREGNPVYLIMGMDSFLYAKEKNENLTDDNHLVYISYGDCTNPSFLIKAAEIVNKQTQLLIEQSQSK